MERVIPLCPFVPVLFIFPYGNLNLNLNLSLNLKINLSLNLENLVDIVTIIAYIIVKILGGSG